MSVYWRQIHSLVTEHIIILHNVSLTTVLQFYLDYRGFVHASHPNYIEMLHSLQQLVDFDLGHPVKDPVVHEPDRLPGLMEANVHQTDGVQTVLHKLTKVGTGGREDSSVDRDGVTLDQEDEVMTMVSVNMLGYSL